MELKKEIILHAAEYIGVVLTHIGYQEGSGKCEGFNLFNTKSGRTVDFKGMDLEEVKLQLQKFFEEEKTK
jgi:hypothetical protein